jgi:hypothetical protein
MVFNEFNILDEIFKRIEPINVDGVDFEAKFEYGSHEDLLKFLELNRRGKTNTYPLIWLETPYKVTRDYALNGVATTNLIIANLSKSDTLNKDRMETSFKLVLFPILNDILRLLRLDFIVSYSEYSTTYHFNYAPEEKKSSDIWDVVQLELDLKYKKNC